VPFDLSNGASTRPLPDHPLAALPSEDLDLIAELVLKSGSLKDLATVYGVSYPTIRARLDRVIERLEGAMKGQKPDPLTELLARMVERGEISPSSARTVRDVARQTAGDTAPKAGERP
jgi:hypothetical protein